MVLVVNGMDTILATRPYCRTQVSGTHTDSSPGCRPGGEVQSSLGHSNNTSVYRGSFFVHLNCRYVYVCIHTHIQRVYSMGNMLVRACLPDWRHDEVASRADISAHPRLIDSFPRTISLRTGMKAPLLGCRNELRGQNSHKTVLG